MRRSVVPLEWGASPQSVIIPNPIQHVYWKQIMLGEFLDVIFDCPFEMHELVTDTDISNAIMELKDTQKEVLYYLAMRQYSCQQIAYIRGQSDRNIRKVRDTPHKEAAQKSAVRAGGTDKKRDSSQSVRERFCSL